LLKNGHLPRVSHPSSLRRTAKYASLLRISGSLHLALFEQPEEDAFSTSQLGISARRESGHRWVLGPLRMHYVKGFS
jgi:hypothetical protein